MEPYRRLIIAPQLPVKMRYQEWWPAELEHNLAEAFDEVVMLGRQLPVQTKTGTFSVVDASIRNEVEQVDELLELGIIEEDVILHCDLSWPGLFHNVLFHLPKCRRVVICHASAKNRYDVFGPQRTEKWQAEKAAARLYDQVLVATQYHDRKLNLPNTVVMGALPNPPAFAYRITPPVPVEQRDIRFCSVSRPSIQKVCRSLEDALKKLSGTPVVRRQFDTWFDYYNFLDHCQFMVISSHEETYGYQVVDALLRGCIPIAPRACSYPELLPEALLYSPKGSARDRAAEVLQIANTYVGPPPRLRCHKAAENFWVRLRMELLSW